MPKKTPKTLTQYAALPFRVDGQGAALVMMVTSRETKRWILPKGQPEPKLAPHHVAEKEAYEEAGIIGTVFRTAFARFDSVKRLKNGKEVPALVEVYLLDVANELDAWPERKQRSRGWFTIDDAIKIAGEPGLVQVLRDFGGRFETE